jgi:hypothetical protein
MPLFSILQRPILLVSLIAIAGSASAESYYKCKATNGRVQYSDQPSKSSDCKPIAIRRSGTSSAIPAVTTGVAAKQPDRQSPADTAKSAPAAPHVIAAATPTAPVSSANAPSESPMESPTIQR